MTTATGPFLVVGLGNPGPRYAGNRHNVGHMVAEELARRAGVNLRAHRAGGAVAEVRLAVGPPGTGPVGPRVVLARTSCYMNVSGGPVAALARFYHVPVEDLVVVHDDLDLPFEELRLKRGGGEGGHNGLRDISRAMGTRDYVRVRLGIGRPPGRMDPADYVLRDFTASERQVLPLVVDRGADAVEWVVGRGLEAAQLHFHTKA